MSVVGSTLSERGGACPLAVSLRFLYALYAIVPICVLVQLLDQFHFDHALRDMLPSSPSHFLLFQLLFGTPHIIASNLLLASHADYLQVYKNKMIGMSLFIIVFFGIGSLFIPYRALYVISACWTVYHVLKQQHGVAKAACRLPAWAFYLQLWLSVAAGIFVYIGVFLKNGLTGEQASQVMVVATSLSLLLLASTVICQRWAHGEFGRSFLWANTMLVLASCYVYSQEYYFMAILMPRLVHDITAYSFYVTHDVNRHGFRPQNGLFKVAHALRVPVFVVLPALSFVLTYLLQAYGDALVDFLAQSLFSVHIYKAITLGLIGYLALMHYYTESFVWAANSPLRKYIRFSGI